MDEILPMSTQGDLIKVSNCIIGAKDFSSRSVADMGKGWEVKIYQGERKLDTCGFIQIFCYNLLLFLNMNFHHLIFSRKGRESPVLQQQVFLAVRL